MKFNSPRAALSACLLFACAGASVAQVETARFATMETGPIDMSNPATPAADLLRVVYNRFAGLANNWRGTRPGIPHLPDRQARALRSAAFSLRDVARGEPGALRAFAGYARLEGEPLRIATARITGAARLLTAVFVNPAILDQDAVRRMMTEGGHSPRDIEILREAGAIIAARASAGNKAMASLEMLQRNATGLGSGGAAAVFGRFYAGDGSRGDAASVSGARRNTRRGSRRRPDEESPAMAIHKYVSGEENYAEIEPHMISSLADLPRWDPDALKDYAMQHFMGAGEDDLLRRTKEYQRESIQFVKYAVGLTKKHGYKRTRAVAIIHSKTGLWLILDFRRNRRAVFRVSPDNVPIIMRFSQEVRGSSPEFDAKWFLSMEAHVDDPAPAVPLPPSEARPSASAAAAPGAKPSNGAGTGRARAPEPVKIIVPDNFVHAKLNGRHRHPRFKFITAEVIDELFRNRRSVGWNDARYHGEFLNRHAGDVPWGRNGTATISANAYKSGSAELVRRAIEEMDDKKEAAKTERFITVEREDEAFMAMDIEGGAEVEFKYVGREIVITRYSPSEMEPLPAFEAFLDRNNGKKK